MWTQQGYNDITINILNKVNIMDSKILLSEEVDNLERKFGGALKYIPCKIVDVDENGKEVELDALFTRNSINDAIERAIHNPEDMPEEERGWWATTFGSKA